ncbi:Crp/Fnr family transcriptional regulator [Ramlibacter albus]|uniref:Cyclic nucleotide-binding domain-containing protein n=1 Tax=Ramlibacter albus TaxID=2079448 RepID=A0A923MCV9_9BURK|nr:cyclic nucleotide-binding domain-containing protein [Ramlibacter albus]MBC5766727.1 cyclic nucleotide-binding domain-containing protein [Ramlibacter albus]
MNAFLVPKKPDISRLVEAVRANTSEDTLSRFMPDSAWDVVAEYLSPEKIERGHVLIAQGALDRTLYFVESGILRVHRGHHNAELQLAVLGPGAVVGEGAFFSHVERSATVQATQPTVLWALTPRRFDKMSKAHPEAALALSMALGAVVSTRMLNVARKISIT